MSAETNKWLRNNVLRGFTDKRGTAWWASKASADDNGEANHYPGAIPVADLYRRLFGWHATARAVRQDIGAGNIDAVRSLMASPGMAADTLPGDLRAELLAALGVVEIPGQMAWGRSDNNHVMGIHGDGYKGHQYGEWCVRNVETMIDGDLNVANAGLLKGGAVAWVQIETPDNIETPEGVTIRPFIMATTSFDGSIATTYKDGYTDVVCDNTRAAFLAEKSNVYRVKHTRNSSFDVLTARAAMNIIHANTESFMAEIAALCAVDVSDKEWQGFIEAHAPIETGAKGRGVTMAENKRAELTRLYNSDVRVQPWRGTAWGVVQAVNTYTHHVGIVRNMDRTERNMMRAVTGGTATLDRDTLTTLESVIGRTVKAPALATA